MNDPTPVLPVAVYGTLRTGEYAHDRYLAGHPAVVSTVPGLVDGYEIHVLSLGYPVAVPEPGSTLVVEVITIEDSPSGQSLRDDLDGWEGYREGEPSQLYDRIVVPVRTAAGEVRAWLYVAGNEVDHGEFGDHSRIHGGDWTAR